MSLLCEEGRFLQQRLPKNTARSHGNCKLARTFSNLMFKGKTSAALDLLACKGNSGVLHVNDHANRDDPTSPLLDALKSKHPAAVSSTVKPSRTFCTLSFLTVSMRAPFGELL